MRHCSHSHARLQPTIAPSRKLEIAFNSLIKASAYPQPKKAQSRDTEHRMTASSSVVMQISGVIICYAITIKARWYMYYRQYCSSSQIDNSDNMSVYLLRVIVIFGQATETYEFDYNVSSPNNPIAIAKTRTLLYTIRGTD
ncbi:hypothetical protein SeLEV6574_g05306 [Synchytrium endobioticum]|uniref:Uncharacterized protein n=1 Tax=Synchytrium endobioticum TaxID=286115 RepID=A0A507CUY6_9FUNG|nr:hypothetical protein SeLEV6574_g05306 [Synchytrium endobioticum]